MIYGRIDMFACGYQVKNYKLKERVENGKSWNSNGI